MSADGPPLPPPMSVAAGAPGPERRMVLRLVFDPAPTQTAGVEGLLLRLMESRVSITSTHTPESYYLVRARVPEGQSHRAVELASGTALWTEVHRDEEVEALRVVFHQIVQMSSTGNVVTRTLLGPPGGVLDRAERWGVAPTRGDAALALLAQGGWLTIDAIAQGVRRVGFTPAGERMAATWLTHRTAQALIRVGEMTWDLGREANDLHPPPEGPPSTSLRYVERRASEIWLGELMLTEYREGVPKLELFDRILALPAGAIPHPIDENLMELGGPIRGIRSMDQFRSYKSQLARELRQAAGCDVLDPRKGVVGLAPGIAPRPRRGSSATASAAPPAPPTPP